LRAQSFALLSNCKRFAEKAGNSSATVDIAPPMAQITQIVCGCANSFVARFPKKGERAKESVRQKREEF